MLVHTATSLYSYGSARWCGFNRSFSAAAIVIKIVLCTAQASRVSVYDWRCDRCVGGAVAAATHQNHQIVIIREKRCVPRLHAPRTNTPMPITNSFNAWNRARGAHQQQCEILGIIKKNTQIVINMTNRGISALECNWKWVVRGNVGDTCVHIKL